MEDLEDIELTNVMQIIEAYAKEYKEVLVRNLKSSGRVASHQLIENIDTTVKINGYTVNVTLIAADYIKQVCEGRPPTSKGGTGQLKLKIRKWIDEKGILPRQGVDKNGKKYLPTKDQLAYLITRKIHKEGFEGTDDLTRTTREVNEKYLAMLQQALQQDFNLYSIKILKKINSMIKI